MSCWKSAVVAVSLHVTLFAVVGGSIEASNKGIILLQGNLFRHLHEQHHKNHHKRGSQRPDRSIVALQSDEFKESIWQYQGERMNDDWEKDLITDDDDKLAETMRQYAKDVKVNGTRIVPTVQSSSEFSEDYPKDLQGPLGTTSQSNAPQNGTNSTPEPSGISSAKEVDDIIWAVQALKEELEKAQGKAKHAHESVVDQETKMNEQKKAFIQAKAAFDLSTKELSKCQKLEDKLAVDATIAQQANAALVARLKMLEKQRRIITDKVHKAKQTIESQKNATEEVKMKLDDATKEQEKMEKNEEATEAVLKNATAVLDSRNQTLVKAMIEANSTLAERHEEAKKKAKISNGVQA